MHWNSYHSGSLQSSIFLINAIYIKQHSLAEIENSDTRARTVKNIKPVYD